MIKTDCQFSNESLMIFLQTNFFMTIYFKHLNLWQNLHNQKSGFIFIEYKINIFQFKIFLKIQKLKLHKNSQKNNGIFENLFKTVADLHFSAIKHILIFFKRQMPRSNVSRFSMTVWPYYIFIKNPCSYSAYIITQACLIPLALDEMFLIYFLSIKNKILRVLWSLISLTPYSYIY